MIGTKLAHYEITHHIGSGGMGDVYQATDTKLGRNVAVKLLPEVFARDAERVAQLEREARVLASLNHPHIAAIYGIEESGDRKLIVMELAEGETLAARIARGPLPIHDALAIAQQIAEALEAAHEKGVMHRDLKPANIKVSGSGQVKVLDFGLAKALADDGKDVNLSNSPTLISMAATNAGVILGTAAYMSPEQAKGMKVDRRTDVFSFGAVLYEMITGKQAFHGDTLSDVLARVITVEPDWNLLPKDTPSSVRRLLRRCLQKDRNRRIQTTTDVRNEIEEVKGEAESNVSVGLSPAQAHVTQRPWMILAAVLLILLATVSFVHFREISPAESLVEMRTQIITPATTDPVSFALSPDGRQIVFSATADDETQLWLRPLDKITAQPLPGTERGTYPFWSPDSRAVGFFADGKLKRIDVPGGSPQTLTNAFPAGGAWSPQGFILFSTSNTSPLSRIPAAGGGAVAAIRLEIPGSSPKFPTFLPDGRRFLVFERSTIFLGSVDSTETKRLTTADTAGVYVPGGWLMYVQAGTLLARRLDIERRELVGDPVSVANPVEFQSGRPAPVSVSATGLVAYRASSTATHQLVWFDRTGKALGTVGPRDETLSSPRISPDGRRVAVRRVVQNNQDIWLFDGTHETRFTFDPSSEGNTTWSPDGSRIVFDSARKGGRNLYSKPSSGAGGEELFVESTQSQIPDDWSLDGRFFSYSAFDTDNPTSDSTDLWMLPLGGDRKPFVFLKTKFNERRAVFSPDGRWVAYKSNESGMHEIYVRPFPGPGGQWQISTAGGIDPRWAANGKELYYIAPDGTLMAAPIATASGTIEPSMPIALFRTRIVGGGSETFLTREYDVAPDGRFLINTVMEDATSPITLIQNWKSPAR